MAYLKTAREPLQRLDLPWRKKLRHHYEAVIARVATDCPLCSGRAMGGRLCSGCLDDVQRSMRFATLRCKVCCLALSTPLACPDCTSQPPAFDKVIAAFDYAQPGDLLIGHFKAGRRFGLARMLAEMLVSSINTATPKLPRNTILVPVPASQASIRERGFNPAAEIARYLAQQLNLPCRPGLLMRRVEGGRQKHLTRAQRAQSALQSYSCPVRVEHTNIAIVDDVLTTGSTLHGIARELKAAGAEKVFGLVLARTPYR